MIFFCDLLLPNAWTSWDFLFKRGCTRHLYFFLTYFCSALQWQHEYVLCFSLADYSKHLVLFIELLINSYACAVPDFHVTFFQTMWWQNSVWTDRTRNIALNFFQPTHASQNLMACLISLLDVHLPLLWHVPGNEQKNRFKNVHFVKTTENRKVITNGTYWKIRRGESSAPFYERTLVPSATPKGIKLTLSNTVHWTVILIRLPK